LNGKNIEGPAPEVPGRLRPRQDKMKPFVILAAIAALGLPLLLPQSGAAQETATLPAVERGAVTDLPLPRFVTLKTKDGNARRGPGLTHRIDWVFTRAGMPLLVTAEHEHWRRVEDVEGVGGWVHYALLSGSRSALVNIPILDLHASPSPDSQIVMRAEAGVIAKLLECRIDWCRLTLEGERGWAPKTALWGVLPDEIFD
jgi:SH3-like domain-containing protein